MSRSTESGTLMMQYIEETPEMVERYLSAPMDEDSLALASAIKSVGSVVLTGCGTSYNIAMAGARYFQEIAGVDARAIPSFDLANYSAGLTRGKVVIAISHSGATKATLDALKAIRGIPTLSVGFSSSPSTKLAAGCDRHVVLPAGFEKAYPKTATFTCGCFQLLRIAEEVAASSDPAARRQLDSSTMKAVLQRSLNDNRSIVREAAHAWVNHQIFTFLGGGPAWVTAVEVALKMRENNYTCSEGYEVEEITHGRTASFDSGRPVICIALRGPSLQRAADVVNTAKYVGAPTMVVLEDEADWMAGGDFVIRIPKAPSESIAALAAVVPLQVFSHDVAVARGLNPDSIRLDQPQHAYAHSKWVFPPGTH